MTLNDYQTETSKTAIYPQPAGLEYTALGLAGEAGEYCNKVKKIIRDQTSRNEMALVGELGDCLWYVAQAAVAIGTSLEFVAQANLHKLKKRQDEGTISGSGDNR